ncbi:MAG: PIN domain-containing protein [Caulobacteraceae bacterium]
MIGLDTNVILRHLLQDDAVQSARASAYIEGRLTQAEPGFVSVVAMVETVWVLERVYRFTHVEIASAVERLLQVGVLVIEHAAEVFIAMVALRSGRGAFADALIAALGASAGCSHTITFDRGAARLGGFELVPGRA